MPTKAIMLFQSGDQQAGWSEVYWLDAGSINSAKQALDSIAVVRLRILDRKNSIIGFRITNPLQAVEPPFVRAQRAAQLFPGNLPGSSLGFQLGADVVWTAAQLRLSSADGTVFKNQIYRGLSDVFWDHDSDLATRNAMQSFLLAWKSALSANGAQIRHFNRVTKQFVFVPIAQVAYRRITHRNTGRSFDTLRGRR